MAFGEKTTGGETTPCRLARGPWIPILSPGVIFEIRDGKLGREQVWVDLAAIQQQLNAAS